MIFTARELAWIRRLELLAARVAKGTLHGERETARAGPGSGFREHRAYAPGDALRRVDWNVYARMDELVVKEFDAEEAIDLLVVQDCSASMRGAAAECAARVAGALGAIALGSHDRVLWSPAGGTRPPESFAGRARKVDLLAAVGAETAGRTDLLAAVRAVLPRHRRGGVAFVISDFFDPAGTERALASLMHHRYRVRAVLVEDAGLPTAPRSGRTRLVDRETGESLVLDMTDSTIAAYQRAREARAQGLRAFCRQRGAGFLRVRADQPFFEIVRAAIARGWLAP